MMQLYSPGSQVKLLRSSPNAEGVIEQVSIRMQNAVWYTIAYWDGRDRKTVDVQVHEFEPKQYTNTFGIGFFPEKKS